MTCRRINSLRYFWNTITRLKHEMLSCGAVEEECPYCGNITPVYYHRGCKGTTGCLWCGKEIGESFCEICGKPFAKDEMPYIDTDYDVYVGAHKSCLEEKKQKSLF